ncbi:hypothetical protein AC578_8856 [Pseudocercospora eumusae]|uniref:Uncharacterized protein n=1 Tax=Pseudocercospora eumusae TaxID=321146 RepID=A0A139H5I7_9PEZI|nr:hypothetical protein AC578_8856 [Pseudocercospora eumusae]
MTRQLNKESGLEGITQWQLNDPYGNLGRRNGKSDFRRLPNNERFGRGTSASQDSTDPDMILIEEIRELSTKMVPLVTHWILKTALQSVDGGRLDLCSRPRDELSKARQRLHDAFRELCDTIRGQSRLKARLEIEEAESAYSCRVQNGNHLSLDSSGLRSASHTDLINHRTSTAGEKILRSKLGILRRPSDAEG